MPGPAEDDLPPVIAPDAQVPALLPEEGALAVVPTAQERMRDLAAEPGLAEQVDGDADEDLFREAFGGGGNDGLDDDALADAMIDAARRGEEVDFDMPDAAPRAPVYRAPMAAQAAIAAAVAADQGVARLDGPPGAAGPGQALAQRNPFVPLFQLPGYAAQDRQGEAVRAVGRSIFRALPCFRRMEQECRAAGRDPLGEVNVMSDLSGATMTEMNAMAGWIAANGQMVQAEQIVFPAGLRGYRPDVVLATTENDSFLMVRELQANGCPQDATYLYSWSGGQRAYQNNQVAMPVPAAERAPAAAPALPPRRLALNPVAEAAPRQVAQAVVPQRALPAPAAEAPAVALPPRRRAGAAPAAAAIAAPVAAAKPAVNAMQALRGAGFASCGTPDGPALKRATPDGGAVLVLGQGGSLSLAREFQVRHVDATGAEQSRNVAGSALEVLAMADAIGTPAPRPRG